MTTGEGGMVECSDRGNRAAGAAAAQPGDGGAVPNEIVGLNNRMTDVAAAIGRVQLRRLSGWNDERRAVAAAYSAGLNGVVTPYVIAQANPVWHQYTVRATDRDALLVALDDAGVDAAVYYPVPTHLLPAYDLDVVLPETERACREVLAAHPARADRARGDESWP